tara:strand:+ start:577 stop:1344 length:768 start_codon:yes stop_codon:yes gene_type:complete
MITILSPAKTLDFDSHYDHLPVQVPGHIEDSEKVMNKLKKLSKKKIGTLMSLSKDLVELNVQRYQEWSTDFDKNNSRPALLAFNGEVYRGIDAKSFTEAEMQFAENHLRLLSGLHGVLNPLDYIQPYRLEMGTSISIGRRKNLYQFWSEKMTKDLNHILEQSNSNTLINLASNEYSKAVNFDKIKGKVITPVFKDLKNGEYKVVMTWAKSARGKMAGFIVRNNINDPQDLIRFDDYKYSEPMSSDSEWVFVRGVN